MAVAPSFYGLFGLVVGACWNTANLVCLGAIAHQLGAPRPKPLITVSLVVLKTILLFGVGSYLLFRVTLPVGWLAGGVALPFCWLIVRTVRRCVADGATR